MQRLTPQPALHGSKDPAKNVRLSNAQIPKIALSRDHVEELEVTDWAGESDLTETLSGDRTAVTSTSSSVGPVAVVP